MRRPTTLARCLFPRSAACAALASFLFLAGASGARPASAACSPSVPDAPWCPCAAFGAEWPTVEDGGALIRHARATIGAATSCLRNGGQPYWQMQMFVPEPNNANRIATLDPNIGTNFRRQAWCTETVAYWHYQALMPYVDGYENPDWFPTSYVTNTTQMRTWYQTEEQLLADGDGGRGRWISGIEIDYANFQPGVNGPCPGAYQAWEAYDSTGVQWADSCHHSQVVDSMVIWRWGSVDGPVQAVDVHVVDGNAGNGTFVDVNGVNVSRGIVRDSEWYRNVLQYTLLGKQSLGCGYRKIRGWGVDLYADGSTRCDDARTTTIVIPYTLAYAAPLPPEPPEFLVGTIIEYVHTRPGPILVTTNWNPVQTGNGLPGRANHWTIPAGTPSVNPVYVEIDFRANLPLAVRGVVIDWKGGVVPSQYQVQWAAETGGWMSRTYNLPSGAGPPDPGTEQIPLTMPFGPASNYPVRYLRLAIPNAALTQQYEVSGLHLLFDFGTEDDNGTVDNSPSPVGVAPGSSHGSLRLAPGVPNPFAVRTTIAYELPRGGEVEIAIYDVAGRRVRSFPAVVAPAGRGEIAWDGLDDAGLRLRGGSYFVEVRLGGERGVRRVVLLR